MPPRCQKRNLRIQRAVGSRKADRYTKHLAVLARRRRLEMASTPQQSLLSNNGALQASSIPSSQRTKKRALIAAASFAPFFSPLTASIYHPAHSTIAPGRECFGVQGQPRGDNLPHLPGHCPNDHRRILRQDGSTCGVCSLPHHISRRYLGMGLQNRYAALLVLRCGQSAGSSGIVALANGPIGDTTTSEQTGQYFAFASLGALLGARSVLSPEVL